MKLEGQIALVTGASRGMGRAIGMALAREGADVVLTARDKPELETAHAEITRLGRTCLTVVADLADAQAVDTVWDAAMKAFGRVDVLVNNAGIGSSSNPKPVVSFDDSFWDLTLRVNLTVPYLLCKRAVRGMIERRHGRIINVASIAGKTGTVHGAAYAASKHGLLGLTRTLAMEVVKDGVTVNAICPGVVRSKMNDLRLQYDAKRLGKTFDEVERSAVPIGRRLEPEEIAELAVYLASPLASVVTGQAFVIDGGALMS